jgi:transposase
MHYVGIDIGKRYHYASLMTENTPATKPVRFNSVQEGYELFLAYLVQHNCRTEDTIIGLEATGHYWLTLFEKLKRDGYTVYVLNPLQVDSYRNENIRGAKTDEIDCQLIAKIIRFGSGQSTHLPKEELFVLREICRFRADIRKRTTTLKLKIIAIVDQVFPEYQSVFPDIFCKTAQELLKEYTTVEMIAEEDVEKLTQVIKMISKQQFTEKHALALKTKAKATFGLRFGLDAFSLKLRILIEELEHLETQIKLLEKEIEIAVAKQHTQLTSVPGVSAVIAGTILGETAEFHKASPDPRSLLAYAGLEPRVRKSGIWVGKMKMSKRGSPYLRYAITTAAFHAAHTEPMFQKIYLKQQGRGKVKMVALTYVAKKMAYVIASILRTNLPYHPEGVLVQEG